MKRLLMGIVVIGMMLATGASYAQEGGPAMPAKVRAFLNRLTGSWDCGGSFEGTCEVHWDSGGAVLIDSGQFKEDDVSGTWSGVWYWDGLSEDGVIVSWGSPADRGFSYGRLDGKVLSPTVMEARRSGVRLGKPITANVRIEFQDLNRYIWTATDVIVGGEKQPDYTDIYTRAKAASDEEELAELQQVWCRAEAGRDVATLGRLLANEYVLVISDGTPLTRAQLISEVQSGQSPTTGLTVEGTRVRLYGDMAVVKGIVKWADAGGTRHQSLFTETWLKRDGRWQCLATHESGEREVIEAAKLSEAMKKLEVMAGNWSYEGEQAAPPVAGLPYGGAGKFSGTTKARFVLNGRFLEEIIDDRNPGGVTRAVSMTGYDPQTKKYVANGFVSDGSKDRSVATVSDDGLTWTSRSTTTTKDGKEVLVRSILTYAPDGNSYTGITEASPDSGQTWTLWYREQGKRQSK